MFGYKPKTTGLATTDLDFYQLIPSKVEGTQTVPDYSYSLVLTQILKSQAKQTLQFLLILRML